MVSLRPLVPASIAPGNTPPAVKSLNTQVIRGTRSRPPQPISPSHEFQPDPIIVNYQISTSVAPDRAGIDLLHLLRHHAHINSLISALVTEAVKSEAVFELCQRDDVFLEAEIGTPPPAAPATAAADMPSAASTAAKLRSPSATTSANGRVAPTPGRWGEMGCATIAEACVPSVGKVSRFQAVTWIKGIHCGSAFRLCRAKIRLVAWQTRLPS